MEKPSLDEIIEKLGQLDSRQWIWHEWPCFSAPYFGPYFTARIGGIEFSIWGKRDTGLFKDKRYHYLTIKDWEGKTQLEYSGKNNDLEGEKISSLYERLYGRLNAHRTGKFYEMLYEFIEQTDCKIDKKPELEKVIKKLEQLDIRQWNWNRKYSEFTTETNGLTFRLSINKEFQILSYFSKRIFKQTFSYHELIIKNKEESKRVEYSNKDENSFEEKELTRLYDQLYQSYQPLITNKKTEFENMLNSFLQD